MPVRAGHGRAIGGPRVLSAESVTTPPQGRMWNDVEGVWLGVGRKQQPERSGSRRPEGRVGNPVTVGSNGLGDQEPPGRGHKIPKG
jgi:hypothetical protein